jgi:hypothetical protein
MRAAYRPPFFVAGLAAGGPPRLDLRRASSLIAGYVVIVGAVDEKAMLAAKPNQFSERRLYGLRVL